MSVATPSRFGALDDGGAFHMPVPGLFADFDAGSGSVGLTEEFRNEAPSVRLAILNQWLRAFGAERDAAVVDMFREFSRPLRDLTIVEQMERFRQHCGRRGLSCPADLAVLLQRY